MVALGGGTGMPGILRGVRELLPDHWRDGLTAVVAMTDDGGSSGRLRRDRGLPPPGDVRNCLVALSTEEDLLSSLFQHRYDGASELGGHSLGNLILAALAEQTGSFLKAVEVSSRVLRTVGRILPATLEDVALVAELDDGTTIRGESAIGTCRRRIDRIALSRSDVKPTPGVVEAIDGADLVVIGPGSLYTSLVPNMLLEDVGRALRNTNAVRVFVANLVSERGESAGLELPDHLRALEAHAGGRVVDAILVNSAAVDCPTRRRYEQEGAVPLTLDGHELDGRPVFHGKLLADGPKLRHDPAKTSRALIELWRDRRHSLQFLRDRRTS